MMSRPTAPALETIVARPKGLTVIDREFEVITPMFGGGAVVEQHDNKRQLKAPDADVPIRTASIRGQLRFWWRATGTFESLRQMREAEDELWGAASKPGKVSLRLMGKRPQIKTIKVFEMKQSPSGKYNARALRGMEDIAYGAFPLQPKGGLRERLVPGELHLPKGKMTLRLTCPDDRVDEVQRAVGAWLAFGGIGGRTRRGFGAVAATSGMEDPKTVQKRLSAVRAPAGVSSLGGSRLQCRPSSKGEGQAVLAAGLSTLRSFRQGVNTGRNPPGPQSNRPGRSRWPEAEQIRKITRQSDAKHRQELVKVNAFPRAAFGMPIIFHFQSHTDPGDTSLQPDGHERLASPLVIRPYRRPDGGFGCLALVLNDPGGMPAVVLKDGRQFNAVTTELTAEQSRWPKSPLGGEPDVLNAFLNYFTK